MANISIFLDHDIVVRHFLRNGLLQRLQDTHQVTFVFPEGHARVRADINNLGLHSIRLVKVDEHRAYLWRRLYQHDVLRRARHGTAENKSQIYSLWREILRRRAFWTTWLMSQPVLYDLYRSRTLAKLGQSPAFEHLMRELKPDIVVHPTVLEGLFVSDLIRWGQEHHVPTIFLMNSWDNPAVKAMTWGQPDWLVVWGEQTKRLANIHLGMPLDRIRSFGAAQFDLYRRPPRQSRAEILRQCGVRENCRLVLYAGSSKGVKEVQHLIDLDDAIERGDLPNCHVLFRPHPWRGTIPGEIDFFSRSWRHVSIDPEMADYYRDSLEKATTIDTPDTEYTHSLLSACDLLISPVSTILLEAVMHGKPSLAYLPQEDIAPNFFLRTMANMSFMREFFEKTDCGPIQQMSELIARSRQALEYESGESQADRLRQVSDYFVKQCDKGYTESLQELIAEIERSPGGHPRLSA